MGENPCKYMKQAFFLKLKKSLIDDKFELKPNLP